MIKFEDFFKEFNQADLTDRSYLIIEMEMGSCARLFEDINGIFLFHT